MNDDYYFTLFLIKELKNITMEIHIIVIGEAWIYFDMKQEISYFIKNKLVLFF